MLPPTFCAPSHSLLQIWKPGETHWPLWHLLPDGQHLQAKLGAGDVGSSLGTRFSCCWGWSQDNASGVGSGTPTACADGAAAPLACHCTHPGQARNTVPQPGRGRSARVGLRGAVCRRGIRVSSREGTLPGGGWGGMEAGTHICCCRMPSSPEAHSGLPGRRTSRSNTGRCRWSSPLHSTAEGGAAGGRGQ